MGSTSNLILLSRARVSGDQVRLTSPWAPRKFGTVRPLVWPLSSSSSRPKVAGDRQRQFRHDGHTHGEHQIRLVEVAARTMISPHLPEGAAEVPDLQDGQR